MLWVYTTNKHSSKHSKQQWVNTNSSIPTINRPHHLSWFIAYCNGVKCIQNAVQLCNESWNRQLLLMSKLLCIINRDIFILQFSSMHVYTKIKRIKTSSIIGVPIDPEPRVRKLKWTKICCMKILRDEMFPIYGIVILNFLQSLDIIMLLLLLLLSVQKFHHKLQSN